MVIEGAYLVNATRQSAITRKSIAPAPASRSEPTAPTTSSSSRELKHATIIRAPTSPAVVDFFLAQKLDVAAGVKQQLEADAKRVAGLRLLDGRFMVINQAMATPRGRDAGVRYLRDFVATMKTSGFVGNALKRHGIEGAAVAP